MAHSDTLQRIARLTPLADVLSMIGTLVRPIAARQMPVAQALGCVLAEDVTAPAARPAAAIAIRDGWAVSSADIIDASATAPVPLGQAPVWLETGDALPAYADAVAAFDAVTWRGSVFEAVAPVSPGEGLLMPGGDVSTGAVLRSAGTRLRSSDLAVLAAAEITDVTVRAPRVCVTRATPATPMVDAILTLIAAAVVAEGGKASLDADAGAGRLDRAFRDDRADAVIVIGGTGTGRRDTSVRALAHSGRIAVHGIAISPGETAALGDVDGRPVLLTPARIDSALAVWLLLGRPLLARLSGCSEADEGRAFTLSRKVSSNLGLAEVIPVRRIGESVEPLASGYLSLTALANADGWILVPPDSEGYPAGAAVTVRPLP